MAPLHPPERLPRLVHKTWSAQVGYSNRQVTAAATIATSNGLCLAAGFRKGSIHVYSTASGTALGGELTLLHALDNIHHRESVSALRFLAPASPTDGQAHLLSTGRDGRLAVHAVSRAAALCQHALTTPHGGTLEGLAIHHPPRGAAPPPTVAPTAMPRRRATPGGVLTLSFRSGCFVAHDPRAEAAVFAQPCGGAHRAFAFRALPRPPSAAGPPSFVYAWVQAGRVHRARRRGAAAARVVRAGGHGREVRAAAAADAGRSSPGVDRSGRRRWWLATGAEDTDVRLWECVDAPKPAGTLPAKMATTTSAGAARHSSRAPSCARTRRASPP